jgi:hypothetical protein
MQPASQTSTWTAILTAPTLNPWGGPGPSFIGRRRAWLHQPQRTRRPEPPQFAVWQRTSLPPPHACQALKQLPLGSR